MKKTTGDIIAQICQSKGMKVLEKEQTATMAFAMETIKLKRQKELLKGLYKSDEMKHLIEAADKDEAEKRVALLAAKESLLKQKICIDQMEAIIFVNEIAKGFSWNLGLPYPETMKRKTRETISWKDLPLPRIKKMAEDGNGEAQFYFGKCYWNGFRENAPLHTVKKWLRIIKNGYIGINSEFTMTDSADMAELWFQEALKNGVEEAYGYKGEIYRISKMECKTAISLYRKGMQHGDIFATRGYAICRLYGIGIEENEIEARRLLEELVENGDAPSMYWMARLYQEGLGGCEANGEKAIEWCKRAIEKKIRGAYSIWGDCYADGEGGIKQDYKKAVKIYRKGTLHGGDSSVYRLARCYYFGQGVTKNKNKALRLFKLAASWGNVQAMAVVGQMCYDGDGIVRDYPSAIKYLTKAADRGETAAMRDLVVVYRDGVGVKKNTDEALRWLHKAEEYEAKEAELEKESN